MDELLNRFWSEIAARPFGPMAFRFYLQPLMATLIAIRDGLNDAHQLKPAYFWALLTTRGGRSELLRDGWKGIRKIFILATGLDLIYQLTVLRGLRPIETVVIPILLAIVPYILVRGPVNRIGSLLKGVRSGGRRAA